MRKDRISHRSKRRQACDLAAYIKADADKLHALLFDEIGTAKFSYVEQGATNAVRNLADSLMFSFSSPLREL
jgi:hypothetical protein